MKQRLDWIDNTRGLCMLAILMFHTEMYYAGFDVLPYALYVPDVLATFFVVSGYLFQRKEPFSLRQKMLSIVRSIIVPYFIFTLIIAFPKEMVHPTGENPLWLIITGKASWFVAAIAVAEIIFSLLTKWRMTWLAVPIGVAAFPLAKVEVPDYWCWKVALMSLLFIYAGYLLRRYEAWFENKKVVIPVTLAVVIATKFITMLLGAKVVYYPVIIGQPLLFVVNMLASALLIITLCKLLPPLKGINWMGRNSLYYYFFCGAVPTVVSLCLNKLGFLWQGQYWRELLALMLVYAVSTVIVFICTVIIRRLGTRKTV